VVIVYCFFDSVSVFHWLDIVVYWLATQRLHGQGDRLWVIPLSSNNLGQVVHTPQPIGVMPQFGGLANKVTQTQTVDVL